MTLSEAGPKTSPTLLSVSFRSEAPEMAFFMAMLMPVDGRHRAEHPQQAAAAQRHIKRIVARPAIIDRVFVNAALSVPGSP